MRNLTYVKGLVISCLLLSSTVQAGSLEQAKRLHDRIAGVPADAATLAQMQTLIDSGNATAAAELAMQHPDFYRTTLKLFSSAATNRDEDVFEPLNDYSATVIGLVRDEVDFRQLLQTDVLYVGADTLGLPPYQSNSNEHYLALERQAVDLARYLEPRSQSTLNGIPSEAAAGVMTSRAAAKAFFYLGTNRAMFRYTLMNQLCTDLEPLQDITTPSGRIRQDVSRSPGGDSRIFNNRCVGCHAGMDPMAQAFAYYDYQFSDEDGSNGRIFYQQSGTLNATTQSRVQAKYHINAGSFPYGYRTEDDSWQNYWREGQNQSLGWDNSLPGEGAGAKSLGEELANSAAFAQCQVKKVFRTVCLRDAESLNDVTALQSITERFTTGGYVLKQVFADTATYCMGD
ncbi:hypothetical protein ORJ04_04930 [Rheinheimera baltica]|uniref:DUF1585 domain-containing protein n=1 Tax=Rheinheimera baltica TaxID=67576 RepID=A0ABT9HVZ2_9GAMM|nr:hypothetical protein [Rheinheimera baltica]MDP5135294.1 hypothetical protein [Rheinheimera baltica]MDP5143949.1 hypothetical protein [Rheinheimera baltica]